MYQNWDDLRYFLAVSRTNSFAGAAARLQVTHSTVARRISALEESLDTTLFVRTEKGCRLTASGETLLPYAENLEATMMNLEENVHGKNSQLYGTVRISAPDGLGNCFLAVQLGGFLKQQPNLEIELIPVPMYYSLSKREIDILITLTKPTSGNIIARKLSNYRIGLFASGDYLAAHGELGSKEDLASHDIIDYIRDLLYDENLNFMKDFAPNQNSRFKSSTIVGQMYAAVSGTGVAALPYFMAHTKPELVPVLPEMFTERSFWLQVNPDSRQLARVRATIDYIADRVTENKKLFMSLP
ncbi:LysR family transcriptional regulator [Geovibrio thiophilus]|nr:LysR family transcriptional regulator [Geovibrio thiophilus]